MKNTTAMIKVGATAGTSTILSGNPKMGWLEEGSGCDYPLAAAH